MYHGEEMESVLRGDMQAVGSGVILDEDDAVECGFRRRQRRHVGIQWIAGIKDALSKYE